MGGRNENLRSGQVCESWLLFLVYFKIILTIINQWLFDLYLKSHSFKTFVCNCLYYCLSKINDPRQMYCKNIYKYKFSWRSFILFFWQDKFIFFSEIILFCFWRINHVCLFNEFHFWIAILSSSMRMGLSNKVE